MPSVARIQKEDIIKTAYEIVKEKGMEGVNAREIAKKLECSVQPIFYQFSNMDELKQAVLSKIYEVYKDYMLSGIDGDKAYKSMGNSYIRFARDYPEFFKIIFMQKSEMNSDNFMTIDHLGEKVIETGQKFTGLTYEEQKEFHLKVWIFTHGIATLIVTGTIKLTDEEIDEILSITVRQMIKGYKIEKGANKK